jgi:hypothetical protein
LLADDHESVAGHLADCASCRRRLERIEDLDLVACSVEDEMPSPQLRNRIMNDYRAMFGGQRAVKRASSSTRRFVRLAASIAMIVAVGLGGYFAGREAPDVPSAPAPSPVTTLHDVFPLRLVESYTVRAPDGQITQGARVKIIQ